MLVRFRSYPDLSSGPFILMNEFMIKKDMIFLEKVYEEFISDWLEETSDCESQTEREESENSE